MKTTHFASHVSHKIAELLKQAGFDWSSIGYYNKLGFFHRAVPQHDELKAPTIDVAQSWLRTQGYDVTVLADCDSIGVYYKVYVIYHNSIGYCQKYVKDIGGYDIGGYGAEIFSDFDKAQEAGIKKALEMILEEGK